MLRPHLGQWDMGREAGEGERMKMGQDCGLRLCDDPGVEWATCVCMESRGNEEDVSPGGE